MTVDPYVPDPSLSDRANDIWRRVYEGEPFAWQMLAGCLEPHPDRADCLSWWSSDGPQCELPRGHEGPHQALVAW